MKNKRHQPKPAVYEGVHNLYSGVHQEYLGVHQEVREQEPNEQKSGEKEPSVAPGMRDFLEAPATPEEIEKGDYTEVTTLSFDETH